MLINLTAKCKHHFTKKACSDIIGIRQMKLCHLNWYYVVLSFPIFFWACYLFPRVLWFLDASLLVDLERIPAYHWFLIGGVVTTGLAMAIYSSILVGKICQRKRMQKILMQAGVSKIDELTPFEFETWVAQILCVMGYHAYATKKSGDYGADVIAEMNGHKIAIQVKKYHQTVGIQAVQEIVSAVGYYDCEEGWVITSANQFTKSARNLADKHQIKLITRKDLAVMICTAKKINARFTNLQK